MVVIFLFTLLAHYGAEVSCHHHLRRYKHVALISPRVGARALVEYHNGVLKVPVN